MLSGEGRAHERGLRQDREAGLLEAVQHRILDGRAVARRKEVIKSYKFSYETGARQFCKWAETPLALAHRRKARLRGGVPGLG